MEDHTCRFCSCVEQDQEQLAGNDTFYCMSDLFPVSPGHCLIISRRHTSSFFDLSTKEVLDFYNLLLTMKRKLDILYSPDGYNVGLNEGAPSGQTIPHLHIHLIPRYEGDIEDPAGGIRNIFFAHRNAGAR